MADIHDSDDGFHEIQLSGKQLVFLFMATTVVSVVIFLCGVFVGRGVQAQQPLEQLPDAVPLAAPAPSAPVPLADSGPQAVEPPTPPTEAVELSYRQRLDGDARRESLDTTPPTSRTAAPPPPSARPAARAERTAAPPAAEPPASRTPARPATPEPASRTASASAADATDSFVVQVHALRDRNAANTIVQRLVAKGYPAFLVSAGSTGIYRVQVGRFKERQDAERTRERLKKEEKFETWITH